MRNMSFAKTTEQARNRTKTVTRRWGWWFLRPGDRVQQVEKAMGLKKGEKVKKIHVIEIISSKADPIRNITDEECVLEGFPDTHRIWLRSLIFLMRPKNYEYKHPNRIEFKYVED